MDHFHAQDQEVLAPFRKDAPSEFALNAIRAYQQSQRPRNYDQDQHEEFCVLGKVKNRDLALDLCLNIRKSSEIQN